MRIRPKLHLPFITACVWWMKLIGSFRLRGPLCATQSAWGTQSVRSLYSRTPYYYWACSYKEPWFGITFGVSKNYNGNCPEFNAIYQSCSRDWWYLTRSWYFYWERLFRNQSTLPWTFRRMIERYDEWKMHFWQSICLRRELCFILVFQLN